MVPKGYDCRHSLRHRRLCLFPFRATLPPRRCQKVENELMKTLRNYETKIFNKINPLVNFSVTRYVLAVGIFVAVLVFGIVSLGGLGVDLLPDIQIPAGRREDRLPRGHPERHGPAGHPGHRERGLLHQRDHRHQLPQLARARSCRSSRSTRARTSTRTPTRWPPRFPPPSAACRRTSRRRPSRPSIPTPLPSSSSGFPGQGTDLADVSDYVQNVLGPSIERIDGVATVLTDGGADQAVQRAPESRQAALLQPARAGRRQRHLGLRPQHADRDHRQEQERPDLPDAEPAGGPARRSAAPSWIPPGGSPWTRSGPSWSNPVATDYARVNGKPEVLLSVQRTTDSNAVAVVDKVKTLLQNTTLPSGWAIAYQQ